MKALALVVALLAPGAAARAAVSPAMERRSLVGAMDARQSSLRPYVAYPWIHALSAELVGLRQAARRAGPAELPSVRAAWSDWQRRANIYLSGGAYEAPSPRVEYRQAPRGYPAHPTARQAEAFNRRHVRTERIAKTVTMAQGLFGSAPSPAIQAPARRTARTPYVPHSRLRPAPRQPPKRRADYVAPPPPPAPRRAAPAAARVRQPSWSEGGPLEPLGEAIGGVTRGVGEVVVGGAQMAGTIVGGLLRVPLAVFEGITSGFGYRAPPRTVYGRGSHFHAGVDYRAAVGTPVQAGGDGVVVRAGWYGGYGKAVIIDHGAGVQTLYGHLSLIGVRGGQRVHRGMIIAKTGATGNVTGPHLHYEVRRNGVPFNPLGH